MMMKKYISLTCCAVAFWLSSCQDQPVASVAQANQQAFDLEGFLNQEVKNLEQAQAAVTKSVSEDGQPKETKTFRQLNWAEELGAFADADINKPALRGQYTEETTTNAQGQTVRRYHAKEGTHANVREVVFTFDRQNRLLQMHAALDQENILFRTQKQLQLELQPDAVPRLQRYRLTETQKLLLMGQEQYGVAGEVVQP